MISVIVPAHNEEGRIGRCLSALLPDGDADDLEIIVVPNGCSDRTAEEARSFGSSVRVLELDVASKVAALNAGEQLAGSFPRVFLDADVVISSADLRLVAQALQGEFLLAAPERDWVTDGRPWIVRSYVRFLQHLPQVRASLMGGGVLAVSEAGRRRFGDFPDVIGDDLFLEAQFAPREKVVVRSATSRVEMPMTVAGLLARRTRVTLANREASRGVRTSSGRWRSLWQALRDRPVLVIDLPAFMGVTLAAELRARGRVRRGLVAWDRDESTR